MCTVQNTTGEMSQVVSWKDKVVASMVKEQQLSQSKKTTVPPAAVGRSVQKNEKRTNTNTFRRGYNLKQSSSLSKSSSEANTKSMLKLHSHWGLYYHNPNSNDWSNNSYKRITVLETVEAFCAFYKEMQFPECAHGMFFLMRNDIMPTWEDKHNRNGGCWSFKVSLEHFFFVWKHLSMMLVGETLCTERLMLNGISVSPKRGFCIVKLWNRDSKYDSIDILNISDIKYLEDNGPALYTPFNTKK